MGAPLYFLRGETPPSVTPQLLRNLGLGDVLADCLDGPREWDQRIALRHVVNRGPDGSQGVILQALPVSGEARGLGHFPDRQTWVNLQGGLPDEADVWWGWHHDHPVTPEDLRRPGALPGHDVRLGEHVWTVPIIRRGGIRPALPQTLVRRNGRLELRLRKEYDHVWAAAGRAWDLLTTVPTAEWEEVYQLCRTILQVNYRVGDPELELLAALDTDNFREVLQAACDWQLVETLLTGNLPGEDAPTDPPEAAPAAA